MRTGFKSPRYVRSMLAIAGISALVGVGSASADFIITTTQINGPINDGISGPVGAGLTEFVLSAINNGVNGTGTTLIGADVTIDSTIPLVFDLNDDIDNDAAADVDVPGFRNSSEFPSGGPVPTFGVYSSATDPDNGFSGTMVGIAQVLATSPKNLAYANQTFNVVSVQLGTNIGTNVQNFYETSQGAIDPSFLNGAVTSIQVVGAFTSATFKGPVADTTPIPFANIVVPDGATLTVNGELAGEIGPVMSFAQVDLVAEVPEPASAALLSLGALGLLARKRRRHSA